MSLMLSAVVPFCMRFFVPLLPQLGLCVCLDSAFCKDELLNCGSTFVVAVGSAFKFLRGFLLPLLEPVILVFPLIDTVVVTFHRIATYCFLMDVYSSVTGG